MLETIDKFRSCLPILLGAFLVLSLPAIVAGQDLTVKLRQVDDSEFPKIRLYVSVTDANGNPAPGISPKDFKIYEGDLVAENLSQPVDAPSPPLFSVLVIDRSGSVWV